MMKSRTPALGAVLALLLCAGLVLTAATAPGADAAPKKRTVHLLIGMGQSNMEGRGLPINRKLDKPRGRIKMWSWKSRSLRTATVPLSSQQSQVGYSPLTRIAHRVADASPGRDRVVVVQTAAGGSGLAQWTRKGSWQVGYGGRYPKLSSRANAAIRDAVADIKRAYPGAKIQPSVFWVQGSADVKKSASAYRYELKRLIVHVRKTAGSKVPFVLGEAGPHTDTKLARSSIKTTQRALVAETRLAAFACGPPAPMGVKRRGNNHYTRAELEYLGDRMYDALLVARDRPAPTGDGAVGCG